MNEDNIPPETNGKRRIDGRDPPLLRKRPPPAAGDNLHDQEIDDDLGQFLSLSLASLFPAHNNHPPLTISPTQAPSFQPLSPIPPPSFPPSSPPPQQQPASNNAPPPSTERAPRRGGSRRRKAPSKSPAEGKSETVAPPFPWATNRRATVYSFGHLIQSGITTISGDVHCKRCEKNFAMEYDLEQKFREIGTFIAQNKAAMHHRAPKELMNPTLPRCRYCDQDNSVRPVIPDQKRSINWLFLLLGRMLGCCTLEQLKYFCKHTSNHRTGAKDRVLFYTYLELCRQLDPNGPFSI